jgi:hypothetical protein
MAIRAHLWGRGAGHVRRHGVRTAVRSDPGYDELPSNENGDEAAFVARYEAAIELANLVQTGLVIDATENDGWSPEQVTGRP